MELLKPTASLLALLVLTGSAYGINLKEAEKLAVKNYPKIEKLKLLSESSLRLAESIEKKRLGTLTATAGYTSFNKNFVLTPLYYLPSPNNPPPFNSRKLSYGLVYTLPLYLGGTISRQVKIEKLKSKLYKNLQREAKWQVKFNVDSLYLTYLKLKSVEKALTHYKKSLEKLKSDVSAGVKAGKFAKVDLLKVEYSLKDVEAQIDKVKADEETIKTALETLTGVKIKRIEPYRVEFRPQELSVEKLFKEAIKNNSLVLSKKVETGIKRESVRLTKDKYGLQIKAEGSYLRNYGFDTGDNTGIGSVSLTVSYPVFDWNRKKREVLARKLEKLASERELKEAELNLKREIAKTVNNLRALQSQIEAYRKKLSYALEVERVESLKYRSGKGDMDHLLLAKSHRFMTEAELKGAYYSWEIEKRRLRTLLEVENER